MVKKVWQTDRQTDGRTDRRTDGRTDGLNQSYSCLVAAKNVCKCVIITGTWAPSQYIDRLSRYGDSLVKDKMVMRLSYLYNRYPYTGIFMPSLYWDSPRMQHYSTYRKVSNISRTKSQNFNVSRLILYLSLLNPLKPGVKSRMKR